MTRDLYALFDIDKPDPSRGAAFSDLHAVRSLFDAKNSDLGQFALQVPTDDQLRLLAEDALISLQDSGLPNELWPGVTGSYYMPTPNPGPFHGWFLSLLYSEDGWMLDRIAVGGGGKPPFRGFVLQLTDNRIHALERAGLRTDHFARERWLRMTDYDGNVSHFLDWSPPKASRSK